MLHDTEQRHSELRGALRRFGIFVVVLFLPVAWAQTPAQTNRPEAGAQQMRGMMGGGAPQDMMTIHALMNDHQQITRTIQNLPNGVETVTESGDVKVRAMIRAHVAAMYQRLANQQPIRAWDPLFAEVFRESARIKTEMVNTPKGIRVTETSVDPWVVKLVQAHAKVVSEFATEGMPAMHKEHPLPAGAPVR